MAPILEPSHLLNQLATSAQLEVSTSRLDGVPDELERSVRYGTFQLLQAAGILLRLPQQLLAQAIVVLQRFWTGPDGCSLLEIDAKDAAAACLYLVAKPSPHSLSPRQLLTTFEYVTSLTMSQLLATDRPGKLETTWRLSDWQLEAARNRLYVVEANVLRVLGFETFVAMPHALCINYLQTMDTFRSSSGAAVAQAAFRHLNSALLSPQMIYLTHQPSAIASAAIYLGAKEVKVKLPQVDWWEVFDVDREDLGFLVVAFQSLEGFAQQERDRWVSSRPPLTVAALQAEIETPHTVEDG